MDEVRRDSVVANLHKKRTQAQAALEYQLRSGGIESRAVHPSGWDPGTQLAYDMSKVSDTCV